MIDTRETRAVLGTMTFGDTVDEAGAAAIMELALDRGVTEIDTANGYAGGAAEEIIGRFLRHGRRDHVRLATKAGIPHPDAAGAAPLSADGIERALTGSLRRLGTDSVDLFYLHQPDRTTPIRETLETLAGLRKRGLIRDWAISNYASWQLYDLIAVAAEVGLPRPVAAQQLYNVLARRVEDEFVEAATSAAVPIIAYNPLAAGLLTGRYSSAEVPTTGRFGDSRLAEMYRDRYWHPDLITAAARFAELAGDLGLRPAELALRWVAGRPGVGAVLVGGSRTEQIEANLAALAADPLPADVDAAGAAIGADLRGPMPPYHR